MWLVVVPLFVLSAKGQLSISWNGSTITDPVLIYLDQILVDDYASSEIGDLNRPGALICRSEDRARVSWHFTNGIFVSDAPRSDSKTFIQTRTRTQVIPSVSRLSLSQAGVVTTTTETNGVWHCRLNAFGVRDSHHDSRFEQQINIGIFSNGRGGITNNQMALASSSSFESNPPTFTLTGDTRGGPPTTYTWTRNGQVITDGGPYNISIAVNGHSETVYHQSRYRSTLTVTGHLPGLYQYSVTNRATATTRTSSVNIEGEPPLHIAVSQISLETALVSWTAPPVPPSGGYLITTSPGGGRVIATSSPYNISISPPGVYNITVQSLSHHLPSQIVGPIQIIFRGFLSLSNLTYSTTASTVTVSWSQLPFSLTPVIYTITLARVTENEQISCSNVTDNRFPVNSTVTSMKFTDLYGLSVYMITVTAHFSEFGLSTSVPTSTRFTTLSAPPTGTPKNIMVLSTTSTNISVSWTAIECIERNGVITGYEVEFQEQGGARIPGEVVNETFTASGLTPHTNYIFRVAGINSNGTGSFSNPITIQTADDGKSKLEPATTGTLAVIVVIIIIAVVTAIIVCWIKRKPTLPICTKTHVKLGKLMDKYSEPARIEEFPCDTCAVEGEGVVFRVVVRGNPQPSLTWYHHNTPLMPDYSLDIQQDGSLSISSSELKHSGVYRLLAKNSRGSAEREVTLTVTQEQEEPVITTQERVKTQPVPVAEFGEYVAKNHAHSDEVFRLQYSCLDSGDEHPKTIGTSKKNVKLNRFDNITVYDHHRIVLQALEKIEGCQGEFVNACYVDGFVKPNMFIATQGPKQNMLVDIWRLIWQEKPPTIVMVTNLKENNKKKCEQYWPESGTGNYGPFTVTLTDHQVFADYEIRTLKLTFQSESGSTSKPLKVKQYHYTSWPDHGVPEYVNSMLAFHRIVMSQHKSTRGPVLVHCSAGVGRTGTFICINNVLEQIEKERMVDIVGAINKLRHQRMKMVQTVEQYIFIHDAILEFVTCGNTEIKSEDLRSLLQRMSNDSANTDTLQTQFKVLEQVSPKQREVVCSAALQYSEKNRFKDHLPSDKYRVILSGEYPDYIHAVSVNGYKQKKAYIIAEGPMESTTRNMWKVICDRKCGAIVMLSDLMENGMESCYKYWPALKKRETFGEYSIDLTSEEVLRGFTVRTLDIQQKKNHKIHQVTQFHITCWSPDGECSNLRSVVDVIEELAKVQRRTENKPIFMHCSDTVTRSGMFCAMATVIDRCKTEGILDVFQVVKALRIQKPEAVPTLHAYQLVHDISLEFLDSFDTYANFQGI